MSFISCFLFYNRLDVYIHDYLLKRKLHASAKAFMNEGKVATDPVGNVISKDLMNFIRQLNYGILYVDIYL